MKTSAAVLLCSALAAASLPAWGDDAEDRKILAGQIRQSLSELDALRQSRADLRESCRSDTADLHQAVEALEGERLRLNSETQILRSEVEELRGALPRTEDELVRARRFLDDFAAAALPVVQSLRQRVAGGLPFQRGLRAARLEEIELRLAAPELLDTATLAELWSWASEELRLAAGIEFFNEPVVLAGGTRREHAYHLRLGLAHEFAISEDTTWIARGDGDAWIEIEDETQRDALLLALRVLQRQAPPQILLLPVTTESR